MKKWIGVKWKLPLREHMALGREGIKSQWTRGGWGRSRVSIRRYVPGRPGTRGCTARGSCWRYTHRWSSGRPWRSLWPPGWHVAGSEVLVPVQEDTEVLMIVCGGHHSLYICQSSSNHRRHGALYNVTHTWDTHWLYRSQHTQTTSKVKCTGHKGSYFSMLGAVY